MTHKKTDLKDGDVVLNGDNEWDGSCPRCGSKRIIYHSSDFELHRSLSEFVEEIMKCENCGLEVAFHYYAVFQSANVHYAGN